MKPEEFYKLYIDPENDKREDLFDDGFPLIQGQMNKDGDEGVLYLGAHRRHILHFVVIACRNGVPFSQEYDLNHEPTFVTGLDYGPNESVIVFMDGTKYISKPFMGCAALIKW